MRQSQYDFALETIRDPSPYPGEEVAVDVTDWERAGELLRVAMLEMFDVASNNPRRLAVGLGRVAGMSLEEIGGRLGMTRQGVHKHLLEIERRNARVGAVLRAGRCVSSATKCDTQGAVKI